MFQNKMAYSLITIVSIFLPISICLSADSINVDGLFDDWDSVPIAHTDLAENLAEDFAELKITNDNNFLFLKIAFHNQEHLLQDLNNIKLYIDTDNDDQSGFQIHGLGAELEWCFGCRQGIYHSAAGQTEILQSDIVLRSAPTITSNEFEIAIGLNSSPLTLSGLNTADSIKVVFQSTDYSDFMPDESGEVLYTIDTSHIEESNPIPLEKDESDHIRIISYNTLGGGLINANRQEYFERIIVALRPDIMAFQEQGNQEEVKELIGSWLQEYNLFSVQLGNNNIVLSKYPVLNQALLTQSGRTMAVLINTEAVLGKNLLLMNSHLACCSNNESRQRDADEIIAILRDWRQGNGPFTLADNTPIIHLGDFNLVGAAQQLKTLTEGDIVNEVSYGEDSAPDWNNTGFTDIFSSHTAIRMGYTWRNDNSSFSPGKLDYILYSSSVIQLGKHYILNTLAMSENELHFYGLQTDDTNLASDHLPRVADFYSSELVSIKEELKSPHSFDLLRAYPNPFNSSIRIAYHVLAPAKVSLIVYDIRGNKIKIVVDDYKTAGKYVVDFNGNSLASGVYSFRLKTGNISIVEKIILIK